MSIFNTAEVTEGNKTFKRLTRQNNYWAVAYGDDKVVILMTVYDQEDYLNGAIAGGSVTDGSVTWNGFGADTYLELEQEMELRGITLE